MSKKNNFKILCLIAVIIFSCNEKDASKKVTDSPSVGSIEISADESFAPVIAEQIAVYEANFAGVKLNVHYKTEAECFKDLYNDSLTRMVIVTRGLTPKEEELMNGNIGFFPKWNEIATDAIAVIVNKNSTDTFFSLNKLQDLLTGKIKNGKSKIHSINVFKKTNFQYSPKNILLVIYSLINQSFIFIFLYYSIKNYGLSLLTFPFDFFIYIKDIICAKTIFNLRAILNYFIPFLFYYILINYSKSLVLNLLKSKKSIPK